LSEAAPTLRAPAAAARSNRTEGHARLGMAVFLGTWVMLFAALFLAYAMVRAQAPAWPPPSLPRLPRAWPGVATLILLASSLVLRARVGSASIRALAAALLGLIFVCVQATVWRSALAAGLTPGTGTYASVFFALTVFHALHVACGLVLLFVAALRARGGTGNALWLAALFWDFVTVVWLIIYATVFWL
jgi:cytochrome c oxidase subunit 3